MKKSFFASNSMLTAGIVLLLIGVLAIILGESFFGYLLRIAGGLIAVSALAMIIVRFVKKSGEPLAMKIVMTSMMVCAMVGGVLVFCFADELVKIFAIILGVIILLGAIAMIVTNLRYHTNGSTVSRIYLIFSILVLLACAALGVVFIKNPDFGNRMMAILLGILMILLGVLFCLESFKVRKSIKEFNSKEELPEAVEDAQIIEETPNN